ncbi:MAG: site-specific DNA-methyltransferase [Actinobacteria bacterium]|nr:site-specific DNA-methyltransferase [Actinomycetota bacterium]
MKKKTNNSQNALPLVDAAWASSRFSRNGRGVRRAGSGIGVAGIPPVELHWKNKSLRLIAGDDDRYEWVEPSDYRVSEVRLLHKQSSIEARDSAEENLLIRGDALQALSSLTRLDSYRSRYAGQVKVCYIDPPFNTGEKFAHYHDALDDSVWLSMMRETLIEVRGLLAPEGSVWVHLDDSEQHHGRCLLDEVFGPEAFVATIIWQKRTSRDNRKAFSSMHDYIHVYAPMGPISWKQLRNALPDDGAFSNPDDDPRGPWRSVPLTAQDGHATTAQFYSIKSPAGVVHDPPPGRCWTYSKERFQGLVAEGRVYWPKNGSGKPRLKRFKTEVKGLAPFTIWTAEEVGDNSIAKKDILQLFPGQVAFDTPKPELLMERILHIASDPGELVLDCFVGSGTTAAVAHKMKRRWIAVEQSADTIARFTLPRLKAVVEGTDGIGITPTMNWEGGGGFTLLDVAPSMFRVDSSGVQLSEWATGGLLAEATAAQLRYEYKPSGVFSGKRNATRLVVVDGLVNEDVIRALVNELSNDELLDVAATQIAEGARDALENFSPGSRLSKIPDDILRSYDRATRLGELLGSSGPVVVTSGGPKRSPRRNARPTSKGTSKLSR